MTYLAVTVLGHDRPGIIAQAAEALAGSGMNLEDSSMTLLRGHFAMTLICAGVTSLDEVKRALEPLAGSSLIVDVRAVPQEETPTPVGAPYLITVHGADRLGIVAELTKAVAAVGGNITDLTTRLSGELYVLAAEVDLPAEVAVEDLQRQIRHTATRLGVEASLRPVERDEL